jgi:hypothetical protein
MNDRMREEQQAVMVKHKITLEACEATRKSLWDKAVKLFYEADDAAYKV